MNIELDEVVVKDLYDDELELAAGNGPGSTLPVTLLPGESFPCF